MSLLEHSQFLNMMWAHFMNVRKLCAHLENLSSPRQPLQVQVRSFQSNYELQISLFQNIMKSSSEGSMAILQQKDKQITNQMGLPFVNDYTISFYPINLSLQPRQIVIILYNQLMEADSPVASEALIKQLIDAHPHSVHKAVQILQKYGLIQYVSIEGLKMLINKVHVQKKEKVIEILLKSQHQLRIKLGVNSKFKYPLAKCTQGLLYEKTILFIQRFYKESQVLQPKKEKNPSEQDSKQDEQDNVISRPYQFQLKSEKLQKLKNRIPSEQNKKEKCKSSHQNETKGLRLKDYVVTDCQAIVPQFFYIHNGLQRISTKRLLSFNVQCVFQKELSEVKKLILAQVKESDGYLINVYNIIVVNYLRLYYIRSGECQAGLQGYQCQIQKQLQSYNDVYLSDQNKVVKYSSPSHQSLVYQYWHQIMNTLQKIYPQNQITTSNIAEMVVQILDQVQLFYTPSHDNETYYGCGNEDIIFLNLNHIKKNGLAFEDFKEKSLKPFLTLCLYHEITHKIIRKIYQTKNFQDSSASLTLQSDTIGCKILKIVYDNSYLVRLMLKKFNLVHKMALEDNQKNVATLKKAFQYTQMHLKIYIKLRDTINDLWIQFQDIKQHSDAIDHVYKSVTTVDIPDNFLYYAKQYFQTQPTQIIQESSEINHGIKECQYKFIFTLLWAAEEMAFECFNVNYKTAKQGLQLRPSYFRGINPVIEKLLGRLKQKKTFNDMANIELWTHFALEKQNAYKSFDLLFKKMELFLARIDDKLLKDFFELTNKQYIFKKFLGISKFQTIFLDIYGQNPSLAQGLKINTINKMRETLQFTQRFDCLMKILNFSEVYLIACQIPDFFLIDALMPYQSGFNMEKRLFPNMKTIIYAKDYALMENLTPGNAKLVGVTPRNKDEQKYSVRVARFIENHYVPEINIEDRQCGVHILRDLRRSIQQESRLEISKATKEVTSNIQHLGLEQENS